MQSWDFQRRFETEGEQMQEFWDSKKEQHGKRGGKYSGSVIDGLVCGGGQ